MEQIYLCSIADTRLNPAHIAAVWIYTAGDVFLNVRADGTTFKETFPVDRETGIVRDAEHFPDEASAALLMERYEEAKAKARAVEDGIVTSMFTWLNRD